MVWVSVIPIKICLVLFIFLPERARERLLDLAATQLHSGGAYHQYQPLTKRGNDDVGSDFNDDPLWLVLAVAAYIKETGDWSILDTPAQYQNEEGSEQPIYDHLKRSIQYTLDRLGPNKLPLIGRADWNDCLNLNCFSEEPGQSFQTTTNKEGTVAESVFIAGQFILASKEMVKIASHLGKEEEATAFQKAIEDMESAVENAGWDGEWFRRAYDSFGNPLGSSTNEEGKILYRTAGYLHHGWLGGREWKRCKSTQLRGRNPSHPPRHCCSTACLQQVLFASWRDFFLSSGI